MNRAHRTTAAFGQKDCVIVYLVKSARHSVRELKKSLRLLQKHCLCEYPYPVMVFHEASFEEGWKDELWGIVPRGVLSFECIQFEVPDFLKDQQIPEMFMNKYTMGYRHMCRFFGGTVYRHPVLEPFRYYWRLDTNSYLLSKLTSDPFAVMKSRDLWYGYLYCFQDFPTVIEGLWEATERYIAERGIQPTFLQKFLTDGKWDGFCYYSNFEIGSLAFFRGKEYQDYFDYLDRTGGIYRHRWGDNCTHLLGLSLFAPEEKVHQFTDIAYRHDPLTVRPGRGIRCDLGIGYPHKLFTGAPFRFKLRLKYAEIKRQLFETKRLPET